jgi:MraZ protein
MGTALQLVDDKNRVSIPAKFREAVIANTPPAVFTKNPFVLVGQHPESPCLIAYDRGWVADKLTQAQDGGKPLSFNELRLLGGGAEEVGFDATGRAVLHNWMKEETGIAGHAFFFGSVTNFEIWDPHTLLAATDDQAAPVLKRICRSLMQEKNLL